MEPASQRPKLQPSERLKWRRAADELLIDAIFGPGFERHQDVCAGETMAGPDPVHLPLQV